MIRVLYGGYFYVWMLTNTRYYCFCALTDGKYVYRRQTRACIGITSPFPDKRYVQGNLESVTNAHEPDLDLSEVNHYVIHSVPVAFKINEVPDPCRACCNRPFPTGVYTYRICLSLEI
jgi:hypothetical protein